MIGYVCCVGRIGVFAEEVVGRMCTRVGSAAGRCYVTLLQVRDRTLVLGRIGVFDEEVVGRLNDDWSKTVNKCTGISTRDVDQSILELLSMKSADTVAHIAKAADIGASAPQHGTKTPEQGFSKWRQQSRFEMCFARTHSRVLGARHASHPEYR